MSAGLVSCVRVCMCMVGDMNERLSSGCMCSQSLPCRGVSQLVDSSIVRAVVGTGITGEDLADCRDSDVFASLVPGVPALKAKRCFRSLTTYLGSCKTPAVESAVVVAVIVDDGGQGTNKDTDAGVEISEINRIDNVE